MTETHAEKQFPTNGAFKEVEKERTAPDSGEKKGQLKIGKGEQVQVIMKLQTSSKSTLMIKEGLNDLKIEDTNDLQI